jgi:hypothetical protein
LFAESVLPVGHAMRLARGGADLTVGTTKVQSDSGRSC